MKRGNKPKSIPNPLIIKTKGGFLPLPPQDCEKQAYIQTYYGIYWIDLSLCHFCSKIKQCGRRKEYLKELKEKREAKAKALLKIEMKKNKGKKNANPKKLKKGKMQRKRK